MKKLNENKVCTVGSIVGLLLLFATLAGAQTLSLYDAVGKAVANYPLLQQRKAEIAAAQAHIRTVNGMRYPNFTLQDQFDFGTNNSVQGSYLTYGMVPSTPGVNNSSVQNTALNPNNVAVSFLQWEVYNFGYYKAQSTVAKSQLAVNEANYASDMYLLKESLVTLYLDWLRKYQLLQIQQENLQRSQLILTAIRATVLGGLKPGVDSSTARAAYSEARIAYLQALDDYNFDKINVQTYTGSNTGSMPDTGFVYRAIQQKPDLLPVVDSVLPEHPIIGVYQRQYEQQLAENSAIAHKYLPKVGLEGVYWMRNSGISYAGVYPSSPLDGLPYNKYNYLLGATITYNLFDLRHRRDELAEGRLQAVARQNALQTQQLNLDGMLRQANESYAATLDKLRELPVELNSAKQAYAQQLALYRSGLNTLIDVTNAQYMLLQAETSLVNTQDVLLQLLFVRAGLAGQVDNYLQNTKN